MVRTLLSLALAATGLAACAPYEARPVSAREAREFDEALSGRVAAPSVSCLPAYRTGNFVASRDGAMLFRDGATTYLTQTGGGCDRFSDNGYTLVTESFGGGLCRGTIARVVDLHSGATVGSCTIGDFTPFRRR